MQRPDRFGEEIDLLENATWPTNDGQPKSIGKKKKEESAEEAEEAEFLFSPGYGRRPAMRVSEQVHPTARPSTRTSTYFTNVSFCKMQGNES